KPLVPTSSLGVALAMASASRSNCRFEAALKWCQLMFDPLGRDNTWAQCPKINNTSVDNTLTAADVSTGEPAVDRDIPCCPCAPVSSPVARWIEADSSKPERRAVRLEYRE